MSVEPHIARYFMPAILFRQLDDDDEEFRTANRFFPTVKQRMSLKHNKLVIPRYSALPQYQELEEDVKLIGGRLINTYQQHKFVADIRNYASVLGNLTPNTWDAWGNLPEDKSFVVKGVTNSKKFSWSKRMFAETREDVPRIVASLLDDAEIADQGLVVREYVPLVTYMIGLNGLPITNEWRFFVLHGKILIGGYYWANEPDAYPGDVNSPPAEAVAFVKQVINRVGDRVPFYVVDVAEKKEGGWICIELNDGQQSGLSCIPPDEFYGALADKF